MKPVDKTVENADLFTSAFNIIKKILQTKQLIHCLTPNRGLESNPNTVYCSGKIFRCIIDDSFDCDHCDWFSLKAKQYNNFEKKKTTSTQKYLEKPKVNCLT